MDLIKGVPRSPKQKILGVVSLARTTDKARAYNEGKLGDYDYDCPHDKPLFEFLGIDGKTFAAKVKELQTDEDIMAWVQRDLMSNKSDDEIQRFNDDRAQWHPEPGSHSEEYYRDLRAKIAPGRDDIVTWFDLLDLDEKRPVPVATQLKQLH
jgi:Domain of unknown function (DUF5069)